MRAGNTWRHCSSYGIYNLQMWKKLMVFFGKKCVCIQEISMEHQFEWIKAWLIPSSASGLKGYWSLHGLWSVPHHSPHKVMALTAKQAFDKHSLGWRWISHKSGLRSILVKLWKHWYFSVLSSAVQSQIKQLEIVFCTIKVFVTLNVILEKHSKTDEPAVWIVVKHLHIIFGF